MPPPPLAWVLLFARDRLPTRTTDGPAESARRRASPRLDVRDRDGIVIIVADDVGWGVVIGEMDPDPPPPLTMALVGLALPPPLLLPRIDWKSCWYSDIPPRYRPSPSSWDAFGARLVSDDDDILFIWKDNVV